MLKPWGMRRAGSPTPAPRRRLKSLYGPKPWSRPSSDPEISWTHRGTLQTLTAASFFVFCLFFQFGPVRSCVYSIRLSLISHLFDFGLKDSLPKRKKKHL